jgi:hypothetical protein
MIRERPVPPVAQPLAAPQPGTTTNVSTPRPLLPADRRSASARSRTTGSAAGSLVHGSDGPAVIDGLNNRARRGENAVTATDGRKCALIVEGGAMRGVISSGALSAAALVVPKGVALDERAPVRDDDHRASPRQCRT